MTANSEAVASDILGKRNLKLTEAGKYAVLGWLDSNLQVRHDSAGKLSVTVVDDDGSEIAPDAFFADWTSRHPGYFASAKPDTKVSNTEPRTMTERAVAAISVQKSDRKADAAEIAAAGNPWLPSTRNLTRQGQIANLDPALAARLKQEAGVGHD